MSSQPPTTSMVCSEYQRLVEESERAREAWDERRAEICRSSLVGKESGDQLLRLQAKYARAYSLARKHANACPWCRPVSRIA